MSAAIAAIVTATTRSTRLLGSGFVHVQSAPSHGLAVHRCYGFLGIFIRGHLHESKSPGFSRIPIGWNRNTLDFAKLRKHSANIILARAEGQIAYKQLFHRSSVARALTLGP